MGERLSKQAKAKEQQGYDSKPAARTCGKCKYFSAEKELPEWMVAANKGRVVRYTIEQHGREKNLRCAVGGFAVKKLATCSLFEPLQVTQ